MILSWRHLSLSDGFCLSYRWAHFKKGLSFFIIRYDVGGRLFRLLPTHSFSDYKCTKKIVGNNLLINKSGFGKLKVFLMFLIISVVREIWRSKSVDDLWNGISRKVRFHPSCVSKKNRIVFLCDFASVRMLPTFFLFLIIL